MGLYLGHDKVANGGFIGDYDSLPVGSVIEFDGDEVPAGYEQVEGLVTGGPAVKTGRIIDGKEEYIKRFHFTGLNEIKEHTTPFGVNVADIIVTDFEGSLYSNSGNFFAINSGINSASTYDYLISLTNNNNLNIRTYNGNFSEGFINVSYIER